MGLTGTLPVQNANTASQIVPVLTIGILTSIFAEAYTRSFLSLPWRSFSQKQRTACVLELKFIVQPKERIVPHTTALIGFDITNSEVSESMSNLDGPRAGKGR